MWWVGWIHGIQLPRRATYLKAITDHYWKRRKTEYLLELRNAHIQNGESTTTIIVVVSHEETQRNFWRLELIGRW